MQEKSRCSKRLIADRMFSLYFFDCLSYKLSVLFSNVFVFFRSRFCKALLAEKPRLSNFFPTEMSEIWRLTYFSTTGRQNWYEKSQYQSKEIFRLPNHDCGGLKNLNLKSLWSITYDAFYFWPALAGIWTCDPWIMIWIFYQWANWK